MASATTTREHALLRRICEVLQHPDVPQDWTASSLSDDEFEEFGDSVLRLLRAKLRTADDEMCINEWMVWNREDVPLPPYDIRSPVVNHLLSQWSSDSNKVLYVVSWVECLSTDLPEGFPRGLQLANCTQEIKEGFALLLIPIIQNSSVHDLDVYVRRRIVKHKDDSGSSGNMYDIRLKIAGSSSRSGSSNVNSTDRLSQSSLSPFSWGRLGLGGAGPLTADNAAAAESVVSPGLTTSISSIFSLLRSPFRQQQQQQQQQEEATRAELGAGAEAAAAAAEGGGELTATQEEAPLTEEDTEKSEREAILAAIEAEADAAELASLTSSANMAVAATPEKKKKVDVVAERLSRLRSTTK